MPAPAVSEDILAEYSAGVDSPPPLPLSLKEARRQGYSGGGSLHAMLCGSWAVTGRVCVCSVDQLDKRRASGGGCVCFPVITATDARYPGARPVEFAYLPRTSERSAGSQHGGPVTAMASHEVSLHALLLRGNTDALVEVDGEMEGTPLIAHQTAGDAIMAKGLNRSLTAKPTGMKDDTRFREGAAIVCPRSVETKRSYRTSVADAYTASNHDTHRYKFGGVTFLRVEEPGQLVKLVGRLDQLRSNGLLADNSWAGIRRVVGAVWSMTHRWHPCPVEWRPTTKRKRARDEPAAPAPRARSAVQLANSSPAASPTASPDAGAPCASTLAAAETPAARPAGQPSASSEASNAAAQAPRELPVQEAMETVADNLPAWTLSLMANRAKAAKLVALALVNPATRSLVQHLATHGGGAMLASPTPLSLPTLRCRR